jgi:hypothetical protein
MDHIEWNVEKHFTRKLTTDEKKLLQHRMYHEQIHKDSIFNLWHNYHEWHMGLDVALIVCKHFNLREPDPQVVSYIIRRLNAIGSKYPRFYTAWATDVRTNINEDPHVRKRGCRFLVKDFCNYIVANDDNFALAA